MNNRFGGVKGEMLAIKFLQEHGYKLIDRNVKMAHGELDLVALDGETVVFIEVKSRENLRFGTPIEAVTPAKVRNMLSAAKQYIAHKHLYERNIRFDVVTVLRGKVELVKDAFWSN